MNNSHRKKPQRLSQIWFRILQKHFDNVKYQASKYHQRELWWFELHHLDSDAISRIRQSIAEWFFSFYLNIFQIKLFHKITISYKMMHNWCCQNLLSFIELNNLEQGQWHFNIQWLHKMKNDLLLNTKK